MALNEIAQLVLKREGNVARSEFPHPLVTMDYDEDGNLLAVSSPVDAVILFGDTIDVERVAEDEHI